MSRTRSTPIAARGERRWALETGVPPAVDAPLLERDVTKGSAH
ncbi:hypothetical protein NJ7G_1683 [Natrinema sp. J7-2]|nr:hypothetical protein NJ7G_1683 [Natrinema sp. J7-2]